MNDDQPLPYTLPGRMLLFICLVLPVAGTCAAMYFSRTLLLPGRYPVYLFAVPNIFAAVLLFFAGAASLRMFGFPVRKDDVVTPDGKVVTLSSIQDAEQPLVDSEPKPNHIAFCSVCNKDTEFDADDRCSVCNWF